MSQIQTQKQNATRGKRPRVQVSFLEKERAIERIRNGETKAGISRELGVPESTVRGWVKRADQRLAKEAECAAKVPMLLPAELQAERTTKPPNELVAGANIHQAAINSDPAGAASPLPTQIRAATALGANTDAFDFAKLPTPSMTHDDTRMLSWLNVFNAGLINFTHIASAASRQSRLRDNSNLYLWDLINQFIEEHGNTHCAQFGLEMLTNGTDMANSSGSIESTYQGEFILPLTSYSLPLETSLQPLVNFPAATVPRSSRTSMSRTLAHRAPAVPPPFHVTAPDDDSPVEMDVDEQ